MRNVRVKGVNFRAASVAALLLLTLATACADGDELLARGRAAQERGEAEQAALWYRKAARRGQPRAQINLGWLYFHGRGVSRDREQAAHWWRLAAEGGDAEAATNLASLYRSGDGVPRDLQQAGYWWRRAAEQGNAAARYHLAQLLLRGDGVKADAAEAYVWLELAAEGGHPVAGAQRDELAESLNHQELERAHALLAQRRASESAEER